MATDSEALDILEKKIHDLEVQVFGEKVEATENFNPIIDSLLQANIMMLAAVSGREKFNSLFKRLNELNNYLDLNPLTEDPNGLNTKLNIILSMKDELESTCEKMEKIDKLKTILDDDKIKNALLLKDDLNNLLINHLSKKEKLNEISNDVNELSVQFNEVCLEISKSFFLLNEAISKFENSTKK